MSPTVSVSRWAPRPCDPSNGRTPHTATTGSCYAIPPDIKVAVAQGHLASFSVLAETIKSTQCLIS